MDLVIRGNTTSLYNAVTTFHTPRGSSLIWAIDKVLAGNYIGIRTCEIALRIIDAGLGEDDERGHWNR